MVAVLPVSMSAIGLVYIFGDPERTTNSVAYDVHKAVLPVPVWGLFFLAIGLWELAAAVLKNQSQMVLAKSAGAGFCFLWALMLAGSLLLNPDEAPLIAPLLFLIVGLYHLVVAGVLLRDPDVMSGE